MSRAVQYNAGNGQQTAQISAQFSLPDSGTVVPISGNYTPAGGALVPITGGPLTGPTVPGSGEIFWFIQVDNSGVTSIKQSASTTPVRDPGATVIHNAILRNDDAGLATCQVAPIYAYQTVVDPSPPVP